MHYFPTGGSGRLRDVVAGTLFVASIVVAVLSLGSAFGPEAYADGLRVEGAANVHVEFGPVEGRTREGSFTLLVRNGGAVALRPRLTLDPAGNYPVLRLHLFGSHPGLLQLHSVGKVPTIAPGGVGRVSLLMDVPAPSYPGAVDGTLVLRSVNSSLQPVDSPVLLPIAATGLDLSAVSVVPASVTLHTTTWIPWGSSATGKTAAFELRGLGADALLAGERLLNGRALLHSDDGKTLTVRVEVSDEGRGVRQPLVRVLGRPEAGTYTGTVPISMSASAPTLSVTVVGKDAIVWALAAVALGTVLGGLLPLLGALARQRDLLRARLEGLLSDYFAVAKDDKIMRWVDLSDSIGADERPWTSTEWMPEPALRGAAGLFSRIHWAQSEAELTEVGKDVETLMSRIARWLTLQPKLAELDAIQRTAIPDIDGAPWSSTGTRSDSQHLLVEVANNEPDASEVSAKATALQQQTQWYGEVAGAWQQLAGAWEELAGKLAPADLGQLLAELRAVASPPVGVSRRTPEEWTDLRVELADFLTDLVAVLPAGGLDAAAPMAEFVEELPVATEAAATHKPALALKRTATGLGMRLRRLLPSSTKPVKLIAAAQRRDLVLSIIAALGAILLYVLPVYTDTWGTPTDYLTAVAAGFGAQAAVRWAALPIFESWGPKR